MPPETQLRFAVAQMGARMHYAVPRILYRAGLLERLYTDLVATQGWLRWLCGTVSDGWSEGPLARLRARIPGGIPASRVTAFSRFGFQYWRRRRAAKSSTDLTASYLWAGREFCRHVLRAGLGGATALYAFNSAALELLVFARDSGRMSVVEQVISPWCSVEAFQEEERRRWPEWISDDGRDELAEEFTARERREWRLADCVLCPSEFVLEQVRSAGGPAERCRVVPYGVDSPRPAVREPRGGPLRVLFCGTVELRKGVPYLWQAASRLSARSFQFRLVGPVRVSRAARRWLAERFELTGSVPGPAVVAHYRWADVFVLPTLCEGSATVCYEALAAGLPVITTPNAGSVVRDGVDGFIVPIRDAEAIVEKLELLASQPGLREDMSRHAIARSRDYTIDRYADRLLEALVPTGSRLPAHTRA